MMQRQIDLTEGTFAQDFADAIEVNCSLRRLASLAEAEANVLADLLENLFFRRELDIMLDRAVRLYPHVAGHRQKLP